MSNITFKIAKHSNLEEITSLFKYTITTINAKDYSPQEIIAWSKGADVTENWINRIDTHFFTLGYIESKLVGMASITDEAYLDIMYVHPDHQGMGIASHLLNKMIYRAKSLGHSQITSDVSITAKPFFLYKGFEVVQPQLVLCRGVVLRNYNVAYRL